LLEEITKQTFNYFKVDWKAAELVRGPAPLIFVDFLKRGIEKTQKNYEEVKDFKTLVKVITEYMMEETKLNLVLFRDAVEHMCRISRTISMLRGHLMVVGLGGSGKRSLVTMAAALTESKLEQIEQKKNYGQKEFKEDLYRIMKIAAFSNLSTIFVLPDTQITKESFLEDINNLINSGEVPQLIDKDEKEEINNELNGQAREAKASDVY